MDIESLADWADLLENPTTTIAMTQWARVRDASGLHMTECHWSFEVITPEGMKLDASGHFEARRATAEPEAGGWLGQLPYDLNQPWGEAYNADEDGDYFR